MKKMFLLIGLMAFAITANYAQTDYLQWEVMEIRPKADKLDLFKKGMAAHNKKYHGAGAYKVTVWSDITGPNSGNYEWVMGPTTWTQMDGRPGAGEHQLDWDKNVAPYCEYVGEVTYWRRNKDVDYRPEGSAAFTKSRGRFNYVLTGQMDRYIDQMKKVAQVYKDKKYSASFSLDVRYGASQGPHVVTWNDFSKWSYLDSSASFRKDFEEVHGAGSYEKFINELDLCLDRSKTYDILSELVPELGG